MPLLREHSETLLQRSGPPASSASLAEEGEYAVAN
jgi:hypothetical protein